MTLNYQTYVRRLLIKNSLLTLDTSKAAGIDQILT